MIVQRGMDDDEHLAAEYVLGLLPYTERVACARRLAGDPSLAAHVQRWEARLAPLALMVEPVVPPARLRVALERRLFGTIPTTSGIWDSLFFWRSLSTASLAAMALAAAFYVGIPQTSQVDYDNYVVDLSASTDGVHLIAFYDPKANVMKLNRIAGAPATDRDFELWLIEGSNRPVSLGILPQQTVATLPLPSQTKAKLSNAVLAISDEPKGGSTTGQPTGAVLATGKLNAI